MGEPARAIPPAPADTAHVDHCPTCICDPTSARAREYLGRIPYVEVTRPVRWLIGLLDPEFFVWLFEWWQLSRNAGSRHPPKVIVEFHALRDDIVARHKPAPPPDRTFRRRSGA